MAVKVKAMTRSQTHGRGSLRRDGVRRGERRRGRMRKMFIGGEQFSLLTIKHNLVLSLVDNAGLHGVILKKEIVQSRLP